MEGGRQGNQEKESLSRRTLKVIGILLLAGAFSWLLYLTADLFLLTFLAILLAVGFRGAASWLASHTPLSTPWSLAAVGLLLIGSVILLGFLVAPRLASQTEEVSRQFPRFVEEAEKKIRSYPWGDKLIAQAKAAAPSMENLGKHLSKASGAFSRTFGALANLVFLLAMTVFFIIQPGLYRDPLVRLFPRDRRDRMAEVMDSTGHALRMLLLGRILSMLIITVLTGLGLWWMGIPLALLLAVLAGLLNFIPNLGPALALVPAILLSLPMGSQTMLLVVALYTGVQFLESYIFTPIIQKKAVDIPPALLLFSQVVLGVTMGFLGLLLATPLMAAAIVLVRMLYVEDALEDGAAAAQGASRAPAK